MELFNILYSICITLLIIITSTTRLKKTAKYRRLKKQTTKFGFLTSEEFVFSEDDFVRQLWDENERLEKEVKILKKDFSKISFVSFILVIILLIPSYLKQKLSKSE